MMKLVFGPLVGLAYLTASLHAEPREWTDVSGRKITAEFVSTEGDQVSLRTNGKVFKLPVAKLSAADQELIKTTPPAAAAAPVVTGLAQQVAITQKAFPTWEGYYGGRFGKSLKKFYDKSNGIVDLADFDTNTKADTAVMWPKNAPYGSMTVYVPPGYDGTVPYGVLVYVSPGDGPVGLGEGWDKLFEEKKIIYCSPSGTSNEQADMRRIALALDAVATIRATYQIDPERLLVSGTSGGGAIATTIGVNYAEFKAIDCVRGSRLNSQSCFPYLDEGDIREIVRQKKRYAWISGPKDSNHTSITASVASWTDYGVESKLFEHPDQGHTEPTADLLRQALTWIEEKPVKVR